MSARQEAEAFETDGAELTRALVELSGDTIEVVDPRTGRFLDVNEAGCREHGYSRDEYLALTVFDIDPCVDREGFAGVVARARRAGHVTWEGVHRRKDGSTFPVEVKIRHVQLGREYLVAAVRDVSAREAAEVELRQSLDTQAAIASVLRLSLEDRPLDELLRHVLEMVLSVPWLNVQGAGAIFLVDEDAGDLVMRASIGAAAALEERCARVPVGACLCGRAAATGRTVHAHEVDERHDQTFCGMSAHGHYCVPITSGGRVHGVLNTYLSPGQQRVERDEAYLAAVADTLASVVARRTAEEESRRAAEQLLHRHRLEAVGRLAGGVAHDFNNLLTVINGCADFAVEELAAPDPTREEIEEIRQAGKRAAALTQQLLAFSRKQVMEPEILNLNDVVDGVGRMLRRLLGEDVDLRLALGEEIGLVETDRSQLEQVVVNLAANARDAMPRGGTLRIETSGVATAAVPAGVVPRRANGTDAPSAFVRLSVVDSGCGMDEETRTHVFDPFFTTKRKGEGTGLGLATVHGIVTQSGGGVEVHSEPGQGTTFHVYLPRVEIAPARPRRRSLRVASKGNETILVVEDEAPVRRVVTRVLRRSGYDVLAAADADDAQTICAGHEGPVHLLLTDIVLPGTSGVELARRLAAAHPRLRTLFMSGYTDETIARHWTPGAPLRRLAKPFEPADLERAVREALDATPPAAG